ncbi:gamma-interferon-inducible lysosomal thiol reductase [Dermacentor silvarum]|uniref:gamma-interferon-inducible lysosomal thiol reductase n=1 Tax=Dermacentor silvarum TaxID=543639 RepID=UPI0021010427|nr:gamma-interferon-inducible lysosomal thiol reductase [Dermacentor silvarum]
MTSYGCSLVGLCHPNTACEHDPKVSVEVFYETYCPDSRNFVLEQLNSTYAELPNIVQLQLVPYGKASRRELPNKWYSFDCQHGDKECYGNLLQVSAAILLVPSVLISVHKSTKNSIAQAALTHEHHLGRNHWRMIVKVKW